MNLFLFPEAANHDNGYGIGVEFAYNRLKPQDDDIIVWYTDLSKDRMLHVRDSDFIMKKNPFLSVKSVKNIVLGRDRTELGYHELDFLKGQSFDNIHCDEVIFYRALRSLFPNKLISLRLHNCYSRIFDRQKMIDVKLDWKYQTKLKNMYRLEKEIFNDSLVYKIFISDEDRNYYTSTFGRKSDSETWPYLPDSLRIQENRKKSIILNHRIVWFGGVESHKSASVMWFVNSIFPQIRREIEDVEFHLWGKNTEKFNSPSKRIFGHGFYEKTGYPVSDSLYINPDIIGGGIKLKLLNLIEDGIPFITTPFGYEGYSMDLADNHYCIVEEEGNWVESIVKLLKHNA